MHAVCLFVRDGKPLAGTQGPWRASPSQLGTPWIRRCVEAHLRSGASHQVGWFVLPSHSALRLAGKAGSCRTSDSAD